MLHLSWDGGGEYTLCQVIQLVQEQQTEMMLGSYKLTSCLEMVHSWHRV